MTGRMAALVAAGVVVLAGAAGVSMVVLDEGPGEDCAVALAMAPVAAPVDDACLPPAASSEPMAASEPVAALDAAMDGTWLVDGLVAVHVSAGRVRASVDLEEGAAAGLRAHPRVIEAEFLCG